MIFDIGHGMGSFAFATARTMLANGFIPDCISSDVHALCIDGPAFDLLTTMSKFLCLGLPLVDVVRAATIHPASALRRPDLGTFQKGAAGDASMLGAGRGRLRLCRLRRASISSGSSRLTARGVVMSGRWFEGGCPRI